LKLLVQQGRIDRIRGEILLAGIFEGQNIAGGAAAAIDAAGRGVIKTCMAGGDFTGKLYQTLPLYPAGGLRAKRVLVVGLGREKECTPERVRGAAAAAARAVRDMGVRSCIMPLSFIPADTMPSADKAAALVEGALLGLYQFREFKTRNSNNAKKIDACTLLAGDARELREAKKGARRAEIISAAVYTARDLVSRPGNSATPSYLARAARDMAKKERLSCRIIDRQGALKLGMGAFLSIARGSDEPAKFIVLEYKPKAKKRADTVVLIGKAITFDSGGISLKPAKDMDEMKTDMAGGAAVIGALQAAAGLALPLHVVGIIPATENLPSGHALKPGDVIRSMSGKTIEIISTDAEGRLVLADALTYAARYKAAAVIDLATLTGACIIALGNEASGLMGTSAALIEKIRAAGEKPGEKVWHLPLWPEYGELIKSDIADMKNVGGRAAGSITAGCFLKEFAGKPPWAHLDIAGTAWTKKAKPYTPKGATGVGVRLLTELLESWTARAG